MAMQAMMKDLRTLKQEEMTLMNLATKISDQLNRLRVEELGLQDLVRNQNDDRTDRSNTRDTHSGLHEGRQGSESDSDEVELDLSIGTRGRRVDFVEEEEEEEEEEEVEMQEATPNDIEEFVQQLS